MHFVTLKIDLHTFSAPTKFNLCSLNIHTSPNSHGTVLDNFVELIKASRSILEQLSMLGINGKAFAKSQRAKDTRKI